MLPPLKGVPVRVALDSVIPVRNCMKTPRDGFAALPQAAVPGPHPRQHQTFLLLLPSSLPFPNAHAAAAANTNPALII